jgi:hypothetical protein
MSEQGEAREGGERGETVRQSRRTRGLPPEEQKSLGEVQKEARKAKAAKKKKAKRANESTVVADQPVPEPDFRMRTKLSWIQVRVTKWLGKRRVAPVKAQSRSRDWMKVNPYRMSPYRRPKEAPTRLRPRLWMEFRTLRRNRMKKWRQRKTRRRSSKKVLFRLFKKKSYWRRKLMSPLERLLPRSPTRQTRRRRRRLSAKWVLKTHRV